MAEKSAIATDEADFKAATEICTQEQATFEAEEENLVETCDIPERGIGIMEMEMNGGASMMQPPQMKAAQCVITTMRRWT